MADKNDAGKNAQPRNIARDRRINDDRARQERAFQLRMACLTWQEIADSPHPNDPNRKLYASPGAARNGYCAARDRHAGAADTAAMREEWKLRNERVFRALWPEVRRGDHWAIDRYTRLFAEHVRMLGLNLPVKQQIEVITEGTVDRAIRELTEQLEAAGVDMSELEDAP